ncbi:MAG: hypothetical protein WC341_08405 [Bacteroidales bacterium]|jgi:hypothetical protein
MSKKPNAKHRISCVSVIPIEHTESRRLQIKEPRTNETGADYYAGYNNLLHPLQSVVGRADIVCLDFNPGNGRYAGDDYKIR